MKLAADGADLVLCDLRMPGMDGMELLRRIKILEPEAHVVMITAHGTVDTAVEALKLGAFDYVTKPFDRAELRRVVSKAAKTRELSQAHVSGDPSERGNAEATAFHEAWPGHHLQVEQGFLETCFDIRAAVEPAEVATTQLWCPCVEVFRRERGPQRFRRSRPAASLYYSSS